MCSQEHALNVRVYKDEIMSTDIEYVIGDATSPVGEGLKVIFHCVNNENKWGAGFVLALNKISRIPEISYRSWAKNGFYSTKRTGVVPFELGKCQFTPFCKNTFVCNLVAQDGVGYKNGPPVRYESLKDSFIMACDVLKDVPFSAHMPRICCGLAGGKWEVVEKIIIETLCYKNISVKVYDLN